VRGPGEIGGVYAAGVGDQQAAQGVQEGAELGFLQSERGLLGHANMVTVGDCDRGRRFLWEFLMLA
jgi:hypothetical protein